MARRVERDFVRAGLRINVPKCDTIPAQQRRQFGFVVDFAEGKFQVPTDRWEALHLSVNALLASKKCRVHDHIIARLTSTVISMHITWGPVTKLYTRHVYALINSMVSLKCWIVLTKEAANGIIF